MEPLVTYRRKVRYSDTDMQGIVFNGNYATYFDDALTDLLENVGMSAAALQDAGFDVVTAHLSIDFAGSGRPGDEIDTEVRLKRIGNSSLTFDMRCVVGDRTLVTGTVVWVTVDGDTFTKIPVPDVLRHALETAVGGHRPA